MDLQLYGMGIAQQMQGALIPNAAAGGELANAIAGLGIEQYRADRELDALQAPITYLQQRNAAIGNLANGAQNLYAQQLQGIMNFVNPAAGAREPPWVKELAAQRAAMELDFQRRLIDIQWPLRAAVKARRAQQAHNEAEEGELGARADIALGAP